MGTYLSTPVTEKHEESGESLEYIFIPLLPTNTTSSTGTSTTSPETDHDDPNEDDVTTGSHQTGITTTTTTTSSSRPKKAIPYVHWGVVEMQGWRKSMEDAHVTQTNVRLLPISPESDSSLLGTNNDPIIDTDDKNEDQDEGIPVTHVFGVFDGHGGGEVARFVALYIVSVLQQQLNALLNMDTTTTTTTTTAAISSPNTNVTSNTTAGTSQLPTTTPLHAQPEQPQSSSSSSTTTTRRYQQHIGTALIHTFHALDRMIDDPTRRDEILKLRNSLVPSGASVSTAATTGTSTTTLSSSSSCSAEQRIAISIPPPKPIPSITSSSSSSNYSVISASATALATSIPPVAVPSSNATTTTTSTTTTSNTSTSSTTTNLDQMDIYHQESSTMIQTITAMTTQNENPSKHGKDLVDLASSVTTTTTNISSSTTDLSISITDHSTSTDNNNDDDDDNDTDSLDHPMDGTEEACALDQDMMLDDEDHENHNNDDDDTMDSEQFDEVLVTAMMTATTTTIINSDDHPTNYHRNGNDDTDIVILPNHNDDTATTVTTDSDGTIPVSSPSSSSSTSSNLMNAMDVAVEVHSDNNNNTASTSISVLSTTSSLSSSSSSSSTVTGKVSGMLQRLLKLSGPAGQAILGSPTNNNNSNNNNTAPNNNSTTLPSSTAITIANPQNNNNNNNNTVGIASPPSVVRNGQLMCNLKDHPIHAGATAIVAVIHGRTLTVANAGDSRAVLCRNTATTTTTITMTTTATTNTHQYHSRVIPLSTDHKPMQATELFRIIHAGGFVNTFGRVNGNLNLSRSIGDLKYKQVHHLSPAQQMITAEPDIVQLELNDTDEFIIIGCDGIWDCLSNEKAVEFVATRIQDYTPSEIGTMMLNFIISPDPRQTQGIGGDNMTILIIDLQPKTRRWYHSRSIQQSSTTMSENNRTIPNDGRKSGQASSIVTSPTK